MTTRYLQRQATARAAGLGLADVTGEVVPFEAIPVQPVDSRLAWKEAVAVLSCFQPNFQTQSWQAPPDWPAFVAGQEPAFALPFCLGNFPQLVRHLHPLMQAKDLSSLRPGASIPASTPAFADWAIERVQERQYPQCLLALGLLRVGRQFEQAADLFRQQRGRGPAEWQAAWANEEAALAWHRGQVQEAEALWQAQAPSAAVLFNRGMAALFGGRAVEARPLLAKAVALLSEEDGWHHLGRLYLALAEMQAS
jgi:tetratricopeptide (TPR) repeat protein